MIDTQVVQEMLDIYEKLQSQEAQPVPSYLLSYLARWVDTLEQQEEENRQKISNLNDEVFRLQNEIERNREQALEVLSAKKTGKPVEDIVSRHHIINLEKEVEGLTRKLKGVEGPANLKGPPVRHVKRAKKMLERVSESFSRKAKEKPGKNGVEHVWDKKELKIIESDIAEILEQINSIVG